jgi:hypothetical protein
MQRELEMVLDRSEEVTPGRFISLLDERKGDIERVTIRPPRLGGRGLGRILVEYRNGVHRLAPLGCKG